MMAKKKVQTVGNPEPAAGGDDLTAMSLDELNTLLNEVLEHEDYIRCHCNTETK